jgi:hypothetical protein
MRLIEKSPKLKEVHAQHQPCQIFSQIIPSQPGRMLSLEECLRPLHAFYLATQAKINARLICQVPLLAQERHLLNQFGHL